MKGQTEIISQIALFQVLLALAGGAVVGGAAIGALDLEDNYKEKYEDVRDNLSEANEKLSEKENRIETLEGRIGTLQGDKGNLSQEIQELDAENTNLQIKVNNKKEKISNLESIIENKNETISKLRGEIDGNISYSNVSRYRIVDLPWYFVTDSIDNVGRIVINFPISVSLFGLSGIFGIAARFGIYSTQSTLVSAIMLISGALSAMVALGFI